MNNKHLTSVIFVLSVAVVMTMSGEVQEKTQGEISADRAAGVLAQNCLSCHNRFNREGRFSLQTHGDLMEGGDGGQVIVPEEADESRLLQMVEGFLEPLMPQDGALLEEEIDILRDWIERGAKPWVGNLAEINIGRLPVIRPGKEIHPAITSVRYSSHGQWLAIGGHESVRLLNSSNGKVYREFEYLGGAVRGLAFSADDRYLIAVGGHPARYGEVKIWTIDSDETREIKAHDDAIYAVAIHPTNKTFATGSYDNRIFLWSLETALPISTIEGHVDAVYGLEFTSRGDYLVSVSADRNVKLWDWQTNKQISKPMTESSAGLYSLAVSPSGEFVAAAGEDKMIRIWTISGNGGTLLKSAFAHDSAILDLEFTPDGKILISSGSDKQVKFWDVVTMEEIRVLPDQSDWVLTLAVSPDGRELVLGRYDGSIERIILSTQPSF